MIVPVIVLAEACWLIEHGRTGIPSVREFLNVVDIDPRVVIVPLDRALLEMMLSLSTIKEMHDRQIVATALFFAAQGETVAILTKDANIRDSGLVSTVW
jgi:hypothetical protein